MVGMKAVVSLGCLFLSLLQSNVGPVRKSTIRSPIWDREQKFQDRDDNQRITFTRLGKAYDNCGPDQCS